MQYIPWLPRKEPDPMCLGVPNGDKGGRQDTHLEGQPVLVMGTMHSAGPGLDH